MRLLLDHFLNSAQLRDSFFIFLFSIKWTDESLAVYLRFPFEIVAVQLILSSAYWWRDYDKSPQLF